MTGLAVVDTGTRYTFFGQAVVEASPLAVGFAAASGLPRLQGAATSAFYIVGGQSDYGEEDVQQTAKFVRDLYFVLKGEDL